MRIAERMVTGSIPNDAAIGAAACVYSVRDSVFISQAGCVDE